MRIRVVHTGDRERAAADSGRDHWAEYAVDALEIMVSDNDQLIIQPDVCMLTIKEVGVDG